MTQVFAVFDGKNTVGDGRFYGDTDGDLRRKFHRDGDRLLRGIPKRKRQGWQPWRTCLWEMR